MDHNDGGRCSVGVVVFHVYRLGGCISSLQAGIAVLVYSKWFENKYKKVTKKS